MGIEHVETLIIGGGQAGLAMSHMLAQRGLPHLVLERSSIAERWRSERWLGLRFQFPNWSVSLPEFPFRHPEPDGFASAGEILDYLRAYARFVSPPIRCGVAVKAVRVNPGGDGFAAECSTGPISARNIVVATGPYQQPIVPAAAKHLDIPHVHASRYRSPEALPSGGVLVVGSGASGAQIAEELVRAGREVHLAVGRHRRMPRRYRGRDLMWWLAELGLDRMTVQERGPDPGLPLVTGAYGGHTIDFREFARQGVILTGRVTGIENGRVGLAQDLDESIAIGDAGFLGFLDRIDQHVARRGLALPADAEARSFEVDPCPPVAPRCLDLADRGIASIIWATGYAADFSWIDAPAFNAWGTPVHRSGISDVPGLYFLGLPWLSRMTSSFLSGVGEDAQYLALHIAARSVAHA